MKLALQRVAPFLLVVLVTSLYIWWTGGGGGESTVDAVAVVAVLGPYLHTFAILPVLLFGALVAARTGDEMALVRAGTYLEWSMRVAAAGAVRGLALGLTAVATGLVALFVVWGELPSIAVAASLFLAPAGSAMSGALFFVVAGLAKQSSFQGLATLAPCAGWLIVVLAGRLPASGLGIYTLAQPAFLLEQPWLVVGMVWPLLLVLVIARTMDRRGVAVAVKSQLALVVWALVSLSVVGWQFTTRGVDPSSGSQLIEVVFPGVERGADVLTVLAHVIVYVGYAVVFGITLEQHLNGPADFEVIRHGSTRSWLRRRAAGWLAGALALPSAVLAVTAILSFAQGTAAGLLGQLSTLVLVQALVVGAVQTVLYVLVVLLARWWAGSATATTAVITVLAALSLLASMGLAPPVVARNGITEATWARTAGDLGTLVALTAVAAAALWVRTTSSPDNRRGTSSWATSSS